MSSNPISRLFEIFIAAISGLISYAISMIPVYLISVYNLMVAANVAGNTNLRFKDALSQIYNRDGEISIDMILQNLYFASTLYTHNLGAFEAKLENKDTYDKVNSEIIKLINDNSIFNGLFSYGLFTISSLITGAIFIAIFEYIFASRKPEQSGVFGTTAISAYMVMYLSVFFYTFIFVSESFAVLPLLALVPATTILVVLAAWIGVKIMFDLNS